jgi:pilus assembly protein CpaF
MIGDEAVREMVVARFDRVFVDRGGQLEGLARTFSSARAVERAAERLLAKAGLPDALDEAHETNGWIETRLGDGTLLTLAVEPLAGAGAALTLRRPRKSSTEMSDLVSEGMLSQQMADFLALAVKSRRNIVVSGAGGSGRSTLLQALGRLAEDSERVVIIEERCEIDLGDAPAVSLVGRGAGARRAMERGFGMKPARLIANDVRGPEALELTSGLAGGAEGVMCAVQASSPRDALMRLATLARLAPEAPEHATLWNELGRGVHVVVQLLKAGDGESRVTEIADVTAGDDGPKLRATFTFKLDGSGGRFSSTGFVPAWAEGAGYKA